MLEDATAAQLANAEQRYAAIKEVADRLTALPPPGEGSPMMDAFALGARAIQPEIVKLAITYDDAVNYAILLSAELLRRRMA